LGLRRISKIVHVFFTIGGLALLVGIVRQVGLTDVLESCQVVWL
jgi:hypothetical protein